MQSFDFTAVSHAFPQSERLVGSAATFPMNRSIASTDGGHCVLPRGETLSHQRQRVGTGSFQISSQYSRIVRSDENLPERAVFNNDIVPQRAVSE